MIFGFGSRTFKVKGQTKAQKCKNCSHERPFKLVEERRWFSFFFIPIVPYKKRNLLVCSVCGAGYETKGDVAIESLPDMGQVLENKESVYQAIKDKFDRGEISKNEFIRMTNVLNFETQH